MNDIYSLMMSSHKGYNTGQWQQFKKRRRVGVEMSGGFNLEVEMAMFGKEYYMKKKLAEDRL